MAVLSLGAGVSSGLTDRLTGEVLPGLEAMLQRLAASSDGWLALLSQVYDIPAAGSQALFSESAERLRQELGSGAFRISLELRTGQELQGACAAYAAPASAGGERILLNADWAAGASAADLERVLLEEIGHAFDQRLNGGVDTAGDEGERFAARVLGLEPAPVELARIASEDDGRTLLLDGQPVLVEASTSQVVESFVVPLREQDIYTSLRTISTAVNNQIWSIVSITATSDGTTVYYDHWEDGYDANATSPGSTTRSITLNAGQSFVFRNKVDLTRVGLLGNYDLNGDGDTSDSGEANTYYADGRDLISATAPIYVSRAAWADNPGSVLAGAVNVYDAGNSGTRFVIPVGTNVVTASPDKPADRLFEYSSLHIVAEGNNTRVKIDKEGNGSFETVVTLGKGETYLVNGGVLAGAKVETEDALGGGAKRPIAVYMITGDIGSSYENRWFAIPAREQWDNSYYAPVSTTNSTAPAYVYLYNPNASAITVSYDTLTTKGSTITLAANESKYVPMPSSNSGAHFYTTGGDAFYAVSTIDSDATANQSHDWSYSLIPSSYLTTKFVLGWAPGNSLTNPSTGVNGSPVWVTATADTTIYIDLDGDGVAANTLPNGQQYDQAVQLKALQSYRIFDTRDRDQTGITVFTTDGTLLAAAWGQDPSVAPAGNPALDLGYTVLPFPDYVVGKTASESNGDNDGNIEVGEQIAYRISLTNRSVVELTSINVSDVLDPALAAYYVAGSTTLSVFDADGTAVLSNVAIADDGSGTAFPLDAAGGLLLSDLDPAAGNQGSLLRGYRLEINYRVAIPNNAGVVADIVDQAGQITNTVTLSGIPFGSVTPIEKTISNTSQVAIISTDGTVGFFNSSYSAASSSVLEGGTLYLQVTDADGNGTASADTLTVLVTNTATGASRTVTLTETTATSGIFRGTLETTTNAADPALATKLFVTRGDGLKVEYADPVFGGSFDNPFNPGIPGDADNNIATGNANTATATVVIPAKTKILYLSADAADGDSSGDLDRVSPADSGDTSTSTSSSATPATSSGANIFYGDDFTNDSNPYDNSVSGSTIFNSATYAGQAWASSWVSSDTSKVRIGALTAEVSSFSSNNQILGFAADAGSRTIQRSFGTAGATGSATITFLYSLASLGAAGSESVSLQVSKDGGSNWATIKTFTSGDDASGTYTGTILNSQLNTNGNTLIRFSSLNLNRQNSEDQFNVDNLRIYLQSTSSVPASPVTFTQAIDMATNFSMPSGGEIKVVTHVKDVTGLAVGANNITAALTYETGSSTGILNLTSATYSSSEQTLTWTGTLGSNITIPAGANVKLVITNNVAASGFKIDYDSTAAPSRIELPTTSVIDLADVDPGTAGNQLLGFFDSPFSNDASTTNDGKQISSVDAGQTVYIRVKATDPFGDYDITGLQLQVVGPDGSTSADDISLTLNDTYVVDSAGGAEKIYEYAWSTKFIPGDYQVRVTVIEGNESTPLATATTSGSFIVTAQDLGTPATIQWITSAGADAGATYTTGTTTVYLRLTDLDENGNATTAETVTVTVNGISFALTETGINTGIFESTITSGTSGLTITNGTVLTASYVDKDDVGDTTTDVISIGAAPVLDLDLNSPTTVNTSGQFTENGTPVGFVVSDAPGTSLISGSGITTINAVTIRIPTAQVLDGAAERLLIANASGAASDTALNFSSGGTSTVSAGGVNWTLTTSLSGGNQVLSFAPTAGGTVTTAQASALIEALRYENRSEDPTGRIGENTPNLRTFSVAVTSASATSNAASFSVEVLPVNDPPVLDLDASDGPAAAQSSSITFAASYDVGDVVSLTVDGESYSHTVPVGGTTAASVYTALLTTTNPNGIALAQSLAAKGVSWPASLTSNAVTLTGNPGLANAFTLSSAVNNNNDLGVATYRLDWTNSVSGFTSSEQITITINGTPYLSGASSAGSDEARFDAAAAALTTVLTNAGFSTTYDNANNAFDIVVRSATALTGGTGANQIAGTAPLSSNPAATLTTSVAFVAPTNQAAPAIATTTSAADGRTSYATSFTEDGPAVAVADSDTLITDLDSTTIVSARIVLTNPLNGAAESLSISGSLPAGITASSYNAATGVLTLSGSASLADYQSALEAIRYDNTSQAPNTTARRLEFTVNDGVEDSNVAIATISITPVNDPPVLDLDTSDAAPATGYSTTFNAGGAAVAITATTGITDLDDTQISSAQIKISNLQDGASESISIAGTLPAGIVASSYDTATGILNLTGPATLADFQTALSQLRYANSAATPDSTARLIEVTVSDGSANSNVAVSTITIADARTITVAGLDDVSEGSDAIFTVTLSANTNDSEITLALSNGSGANDAEAGDYSAISAASAYYYVGSVKSPFTITNGKVILPAGITSFFVAVPTTDDDPYEGPEFFTLTASGFGKSGSDTSTILDDGSGKVYDEKGDPTNGTPDDDRPTITVSSVTVSESSHYAVVTVSLSTTSVSDITFTPTLINGSAIVGVDTEAASSLQYFNGASWVSAASGVTIAAGSTSVLLRTSIVNDTVYEQSEALQVSTGAVTGTVKNPSGAAGTVTIKDDGSSDNHFFETNNSATPTTPGTPNNDTPTLSVSSVTISESSPFAVVTVSLSNPSVSAISFTPSLVNGSAQKADGTITLDGNDDFGPDLQFLDTLDTSGGAGGTWKDVTGPLTIPAGSTSLLLRTAINDDSLYEISETFQITTGATTGVSNSTGAAGTVTIKDDGSAGNRFEGTDKSATPTDGSADNDIPSISVSSVTVSESSPFAVVTVSLSNPSVSAISFTPSLVNGSAQKADGTITLDGNDDFGPDLQFLDTLDTSGGAGGTWKDVTGPLTIPAGSTSLLLRTAIINDISYEISEAFQIITGATIGVSNNTGAAGTVTIKDDGTSADTFPETSTSATPTPGTADDDKRDVFVIGGTFNEGSRYAIFTVGNSPGRAVNLAVRDGSADVVDGTTQPPILYSTDGGSTWTSYTWNGSTGNRPTAPISGEFLVAVEITREADTPYEGPETFFLDAGDASDADVSSGAATIVDDGTGPIVQLTPGGLPVASGNVFTPDTTTPKDDDRVLSVSSPTVSESSPFAVFTVLATPGEIVTLTLASGTATSGTDFSPALQIFNGTAWVAYTPGASVTIDGGGALLVRTAITPDTLFEGPETFTLTATSTSGASLTASGTGTITDDGSSGDRFEESNTTGVPTTDTPDDDTPTVSVSSLTVSESSPFAVVAVTLSNASTLPISFSPTLISGSGIGGATVGTDTGNTPSGVPLEYFDGTNWVSAASGITIPAGSTKVLLRAAVVNDSDYEGPETLSVNTGAITGTVTNSLGASGSITITDDGSSGDRFEPDNTSDTPSSDTPDDDRPTITVSSITVSESSPYAVVKVSLSRDSFSDIVFTPSLVSGTATSGTDTGAQLQYFDGTSWISAESGVTITAGSTEVLLRVAIVNDSIFEGPESLQIQTGTITGTVTNPAGAAGTVTIKDDGTSTDEFQPNNNSDTPTSGSANNDTPSLAVSSVTVSESSPFAVVRVSLSSASEFPVSFTPTLINGTATAGADTGTTAQLEYFDGTSWVSAASGVTIAAGSTSVLLRTAVENDTTYEGSEALQVATGAVTGTVTNPGGAAGTITIKDDGTSTNTFLPGNNSATPTSGSANNDTPTLSVVGVTVSESSPYAVVEVTLSNASNVPISFTPSLVSGTATAGTDTGSTAQLEYFDGTNWVSAASGVTIAAGNTSVLLRTAVVNDTTYEGSESLQVTTGALTGIVTNPSGAAGTITIKDDGTTADTFGPNDTTATPGSNDDTPTISVSDITVSESSPFAVVQVSLSNASKSSISFTPTLISGTATAGTDTGAASSLQFFNGTSWVSAASGVTLAAGSTSVLLRTSIVNDTTYEQSEALQISTGAVTGTVKNPSGAAGTVTIKDDGTSTNEFLGTNNSSTPSTGPANNDTPTLSVSSVTISESSPFAVVAVSLTNPSKFPISFTPSLLSGSATVGTDTGTTAQLQFFNGSAWVSAASGVTIPAGSTSVLLRTAITNDANYEGPETFQVVTNAITGAVTNPSGASGTVTLTDDGSNGNRFESNNNTAGPTTGTPDDDRAIITITPQATVGETNAGTSRMVNFSINLTNTTPGQTVVVNYGTTSTPPGGVAYIGPDLATSGVDYTPINNATATFLPGVTAQILAAEVIGDDAVENNESFFVVLTGASANARLGNGNSEIVIFDNDASNDLLYDYGTATSAVDLRGGTGNDTLIGGSANDVLYGDPLTGTAGGNDVITGNAGADTITTGVGNDRIRYPLFSHSTANSLDRIRDFTPGTSASPGSGDRIALAALPTSLTNRGVITGVSTLSAAFAEAYRDKSQVSGTQTLGANEAVLFAFNTTTAGVTTRSWYLSVNDSTPGPTPSNSSDLLINVTGIAGASTFASTALSAPTLTVDHFFTTL